MFIQGKPCKHGHDGKRYRSGVCVECAREGMRQGPSSPEKREQRKLYSRSYHLKKTPEQKEADKVRHANWRKTDKGKRNTANRYFKRAYGITADQIDEMIASQGNACAICKKSGLLERYGRLSVDHDHLTGKVRELLCDDCNIAIGILGEDTIRLEAAIKYLKRHRGA